MLLFPFSGPYKLTPKKFTRKFSENYVIKTVWFSIIYKTILNNSLSFELYLKKKTGKYSSFLDDD